MTKLPTIQHDEGAEAPRVQPDNEGAALRRLRLERQAHFERRWHDAAQSFDPALSAVGRQRWRRTAQLIDWLSLPAAARVCDLGCGAGTLSLAMAERGYVVDALDIAGNAVKLLQEKAGPTLRATQGFFPHTLFDDSSYDLVLCCDLIAELPASQHRLAVSELARLVKAKGSIVCSTALDIFSEDALQRFIKLLESELNIERSRLSYNRLFIRVSDSLQAPSYWLLLCRQPERRRAALQECYGGRYLLTKAATASWLSPLWRAVALLCEPLARRWQDSDRALRWCEGVTKALWGEGGITHIIVMAALKPLVSEQPTISPDVEERKAKKTVWE